MVAVRSQRNGVVVSPPARAAEPPALRLPCGRPLTRARSALAELKAHTPEGLQAKARMVLTERAEEGDPNKEFFNHQYLAAVSLARDILGRA